jgi:hypothetical protein
MQKAKIVTVDIDGTKWEKEGDFVLAACGIKQTGGAPNIEVDYSLMREDELTYCLATFLVIAGQQANKKIVKNAIKLAQIQLKI